MQMILEDDEVLRADVYIGPPNDGIGSDEDSGDENDGTFDNLTGSQLQAPAEVVAVHTGGDIHIVGGLDTSDEDSEAETQPPPKKRLSVTKHPRNWNKEDIPTSLRTQQPWPPNQLPKFVREHQTPSALFVLFFDDEVLDMIVQHTTTYAKRDKGCHTFQTNVDEIRTFIAILLI